MLLTTGGATAQDSPQDAARRIREDAERRARRFARPAGPTGPTAGPTAGPSAGPSAGPASTADDLPEDVERRLSRLLDPLPTGWSRLRSRRLPGTAVLVGPGAVVVVGQDPRLLADATAAVRVASGPHGVVMPVLLTTAPADPQDLPAGALVCEEAELLSAVAGRPRLLGPGQVAELQIRLGAALAREAGRAATVPAPARELTPARLALRVLLLVLVLLAVVVLAAVGATVGPRLG